MWPRNNQTRAFYVNKNRQHKNVSPAHIFTVNINHIVSVSHSPYFPLSKSITVNIIIRTTLNLIIVFLVFLWPLCATKLLLYIYTRKLGWSSDAAFGSKCNIQHFAVLFSPNSNTNILDILIKIIWQTTYVYHHHRPLTHTRLMFTSPPAHTKPSPKKITLIYIVGIINQITNILCLCTRVHIIITYTKHTPAYMRRMQKKKTWSTTTKRKKNCSCT